MTAAPPPPVDAAAHPQRRIDACFARLRAQGRQAVIPYITAGDPFVETTVDVLHALVDGGADILEVGVPFSDPMADGPVIQRASERALARGVRLSDVLEVVRTFRTGDATTPVVLMGYANPVERYDLQRGAGRFVLDAAAAGVDGVLIVDYPPEEATDYAARLKAAGLAPIFLLAPTSTEERIRAVGQVASGYVYYVSLRGVTGAGHLDTSEVARAVPRIRQHVAVPVGVGFGIRDGATARAVAEVADAVVVGSALVERLQGQPREQVAQAARQFAAEIRAAVDEGSNARGEKQ